METGFRLEHLLETSDVNCDLVRHAFEAVGCHQCQREKGDKNTKGQGVFWQRDGTLILLQFPICFFLFVSYS